MHFLENINFIFLMCDWTQYFDGNRELSAQIGMDPSSGRGTKMALIRIWNSSPWTSGRGHVVVP